MKLGLSLHGKTSIGLSRKDNEDYFLADETDGIFIVCDGVGGNNAGNVASRLAANHLKSLIKDEWKRFQAFKESPTISARAELLSLIQAMIGHTSEKVYLEALNDPTKVGMATTLELFIVLGNQALIGHVGDSRIYLVRGGQKIHCLTEDHSVGAEHVKSGKKTILEVKRDPNCNILTRAVGQGRYTQADVLSVELAPDDLFLMVTDGISDVIGEDLMLELAARPNLVEITDLMVQQAKDNGSRDNLTMLAIRISPDAEVTEEISIDKKVETAGKTVLCQFMSYNELLRLLGVCDIQHFHAKDVIIREGDQSTELFIIIHGRVSVAKSGIVISFKGAGEFFGEMSLIDSGPRTATLTALDDTRLLLFRQKELFQFLRTDPALAVKFLWGLCAHLSAVVSYTSELLVREKMKSEDTKEIKTPFN